jgi:hypothetical protein
MKTAIRIFPKLFKSRSRAKDEPTGKLRMGLTQASPGLKCSRSEANGGIGRHVDLARITQNLVKSLIGTSIVGVGFSTGTNDRWIWSLTVWGTVHTNTDPYLSAG